MWSHQYLLETLRKKEKFWRIVFYICEQCSNELIMYITSGWNVHQLRVKCTPAPDNEEPLDNISADFYLPRWALFNFLYGGFHMWLFLLQTFIIHTWLQIKRSYMKSNSCGVVHYSIYGNTLNTITPKQEKILNYIYNIMDSV